MRLYLDVEFNYNPDYNINVIADIKGAAGKTRHEQVIIGAHLDSWHGGTGAVDNATGVAVMVEAMRILRVAGLTAKRTVRIALWGGEEQVFAGSGDYVNSKVGNLNTGQLKQDYSKISAYLNLDNGTGKIRGIYAQGNSKVKPTFETYFQNFKQAGNETVAIPLNYISAVHHTNLDVAEYVNMTDLKESAVIVAFLAYNIAMRDSLLPRMNFISIKPSLTGSSEFLLRGFGK